MSERSRILHYAINTAPELVPVLTRLQSAQMALRAAKDCADEVTDRPAVSERLAEIIDSVDNLIEGLK